MSDKAASVDWSVIKEHGTEGGKPTILVVDDAAVVRDEMRKLIPGVEYQMEEAADGNEGFAKMQSCQNLVLVFLDINMPGMNGLALAEKVAEEVKAGKMPKVPIVMLTTENTKEMVLRAKAAGVSGWIIKPPQKGVVQQIIQKLTNKQQAA